MSTKLALIHEISDYKDVDPATGNPWKAVLKLGNAVYQQGVGDVEVVGVRRSTCHIQCKPRFSWQLSINGMTALSSIWN